MALHIAQTAEYLQEKALFQLQDVEYFLVTHYHPDHAGLAQEVKLIGIQLVILENLTLTIGFGRRRLNPGEHKDLLSELGTSIIMAYNGSWLFCVSKSGDHEFSGLITSTV